MVDAACIDLTFTVGSKHTEISYKGPTKCKQNSYLHRVTELKH